MHATNPFSGRLSANVNRRRIAGAGLALVLGVAGLSSSAGAEEANFVEGRHRSGPTALVVAPLTAPDLKTDLKKGFAMLRKGEDAKAVSYFDRVIATADSWLAGDSRPRRCIDANAASTPAAGHAPIDDALCDAHFGRGYALIDMGRGDLAEADLRAATRMAPENAHFANEYAELFKSRREWQAALVEFERAWEMADKTVGGPDADLAARALRGMGYAKEKLGDLDEAHALISRSLEFEPDSEAGKVQLAHVERMRTIGS